jgi:hypothetical protein
MFDVMSQATTRGAPGAEEDPELRSAEAIHDRMPLTNKSNP